GDGYSSQVLRLLLRLARREERRLVLLKKERPPVTDGRVRRHHGCPHGSVDLVPAGGIRRSLQRRKRLTHCQPGRINQECARPDTHRCQGRKLLGHITRTGQNNHDGVAVGGRDPDNGVVATWWLVEDVGQHHRRTVGWAAGGELLEVVLRPTPRMRYD